MLVFVLSGPQSQSKAARKAITAAGYAVMLNDVGDPDPSDHGLGAHKTLEDASVPVCFLSVTGNDEDPATAEAAIAPFGWQFRASLHRPDPQPKPTVAQVLGGLGIAKDDLRKYLSEA